MVDSWKDLVQIRKRTKAAITRVLGFAQNPPQDFGKNDVAIRIERLKESWEEFVAATNAMYQFSELAEYSDPDDDYATYDEKVLNARSLLRALQDTLSSPPQLPSLDDTVCRLAEQQSAFLNQFSSSSILTPQVRGDDLPKIVIAPFTGIYKDWPPFKDLFTSAVGSKQNLSNTQKFHHLKSLLKDDAAQIIKHIPVTEASYETAWSRLKDRFDRPRQIVTSFIENFMALPVASGENPTTLRKISDGANEVVRGLNAISRDERDCWLIHQLLAKLDSESRRRWVETSKNNEAPTITEFCDFLDSHCEELELAQHKNPTGRPRNSVARALVSANRSTSKATCPKCNGIDHFLMKCPQFLLLSIEDRRAVVKGKLLCFNCFKPQHSAATCSSKYNCKVCNRRHHTLLHGPTSAADTASRDGPTSVAAGTDNGAPWAVSHIARSLTSAPVDTPLRQGIIIDTGATALLPTAIVNVQTVQGGFLKCRVLLDTASELSYITESCVKRLGIPRSAGRIAVSGISSSKGETTRGCCALLLKSLVSTNVLNVSAYILKYITSALPTRVTHAQEIESLKQIKLADPTFHTPSAIDILLGAAHVWKVFTCNKMSDSQGNPVAVSSIFGWVITSATARESTLTATPSLHTVADVDRFLRNFWEIEEPCRAPSVDPNDVIVEHHFQHTHARHADGKYIVELPFTKEMPTFSDTLSGALSRFHAVERRLQKHESLRLQYVSFMRTISMIATKTRVHH